MFVLFYTVRIAFSSDIKEGYISLEQVSSLSANKTGFIENNGQVVDFNNNPVPFVLFKTEAPGIDVYITEKGITYVFVKAERKNNDDQQSTQNNFQNAREKTKKVFHWEKIEMELKGAEIKKENIHKEKPSVTDFNFFYSYCPDGIYGVKQYEKIIIKEIYPGIDWVLYNSEKYGFKYDFVVHPGADPAQINMFYSSLHPLILNQSGELDLKSKWGVITDHTPYSYVSETKKEIKTCFQIQHQERIISEEKEPCYQTAVNFHFPETKIKTLQTLIIDPQLSWSTFYGGNSADGNMSIEADASGNIFIAGYTSSLNFPVVDPGGGTYFQGTFGGASIFGGDAVILKFSNTGVPLWVTYYGGTAGDQAFSLTVDSNNDVWVTGITASADLPVDSLPGAFFQATSAAGSYDMFILKFTNAGARLWATYYGGTATDWGYSIKADINNNVFITGYTVSPDFPVLNPLGGTYFQGTFGGNEDAFIVKFSGAGVLLWSTYYGSSGYEKGHSVTTDAGGNIFITGYTTSTGFPVLNPLGGAYFQGTIGASADAFILKFSNSGISVWATYYGASTGLGNYASFGTTIAADASGNIFVTGYTSSTNLPLLNPGGGVYFKPTNSGNQDVFILKFSNTGILLWGSYYGGSGVEYSTLPTYDNLAIDGCGNVYMSFETGSSGLVSASCDGAYQDNTYNGGNFDVFLVMFNNAGVRMWATYLGGNGQDYRSALTTDGENNIFITGEWTDRTGTVTPSTYPLLNPGGGSHYSSVYGGGLDDAFFIKFSHPQFTFSTTLAQPLCGNTCSGNASVNITSPLACSYSYSWSNGQTVSAVSNLCPGNYTITVSNNFCRDTSLVFTINNTGSTSVYTQSLGSCDSAYINGKWYYSTQTVNDTIIAGAASGCDSIVVTNLTISNFINTYDTMLLCAGQSAIIHGVSRSLTGVYTQTYSTTGCDSISAISLIVNNAIISNQLLPPACDSLQYKNKWYYTSQIVNDTIYGGSSGGCDSIIAVQININSPAYNTIVQNACGSYTHNGQTYTSSGTYSQVLISQAGCDSILTINLVINNNISTTDTQNICTGETAVIHGVTQNTAGIYSQTFSAANSCDSISSIMLFVHSKPLISTSNDTAVLSGSMLTLTASGGNSYAWNTGETTSAIIQYPVVSTQYIINISDENNCVVTDTILVFITNECKEIQVLIPNVFSPNGDGQNDELRLYATTASSFTQSEGSIYFAVYNRWGEIVFETDNTGNSWDGLYHNKLCNTGVYTYMLKYECYSANETVQKKGTITLIR